MGGKIDLRGALPECVQVAFAENQAEKKLDYRLSAESRRPVEDFERAQASLFVLTHFNDTSQSLRAFFNRSIPLWEGSARDGLDEMVGAMLRAANDRNALASAVVDFIGAVGIGFGASAFGDRFKTEVRDGCVRPCKGKPAKIQELARHIVADPTHRGVARMLRHLSELVISDASFHGIKFDRRREFWDAVHLGEFETPSAGIAELSHRRTHLRPKPPAKAVSTIHKSKGLECESVIVMPCDANTFPDKPSARCLLYVALSRATTRVLLVVSRNHPSPLLEF
jgi:DNA helicase-2/ATP-dependent DNA helicase PcrA